MMHALNELWIVETKVIQATARSFTHLLNYWASNPDDEIVYRKSGMVLTVDSDDAYLVA